MSQGASEPVSWLPIQAPQYLGVWRRADFLAPAHLRRARPLLGLRATLFEQRSAPAGVRAWESPMWCAAPAVDAATSRARMAARRARTVARWRRATVTLSHRRRRTSVQPFWANWTFVRCPWERCCG